MELFNLPTLTLKSFRYSYTIVEFGLINIKKYYYTCPQKFSYTTVMFMFPLLFC